MAALVFALLVMRKFGSLGQRLVHSFLLFLFPATLFFSFGPLKFWAQSSIGRSTYQVALQLRESISAGGRETTHKEDFREILTRRLEARDMDVLEWVEQGDGQVGFKLSCKCTEDQLRRIMESHHLEFLETNEFNEGWSLLETINNRLVDSLKLVHPEFFSDTLFVEMDSTKVDYIRSTMNEKGFQQEKYERFKRQNPLLALVTVPNVNGINPRHPLMGYVAEKDTAQFLQMLRRSDHQLLMGQQVRYLLSLYPSDIFKEEAGHYYDVVAVKPANTYNMSLDNSYVVECRQDFSGTMPVVSMTFNQEGAHIWEKMTRKNIDHCIAMVLNDRVVSYPNVQGAITGGRSEISGGFTQDEARDLADMIKMGSLPFDCSILRIEKLD